MIILQFSFFSKTEKSLAMIIYCVIRERSNYLVYRDEYDAASGDPYRKVPGYDGLYWIELNVKSLAYTLLV